MIEQNFKSPIVRKMSYFTCVDNLLGGSVQLLHGTTLHAMMIRKLATN